MPWRTVKYDDMYIRGYERMGELYQGLSAFFRKYNTRKHQRLGMSPEEKYRSAFKMENAAWETIQHCCLRFAPALPLQTDGDSEKSMAFNQQPQH